MTACSTVSRDGAELVQGHVTEEPVTAIISGGPGMAAEQVGPAGTSHSNIHRTVIASLILLIVHFVPWSLTWLREMVARLG
jgi:hypothetical protein